DDAAPSLATREAPPEGDTGGSDGEAIAARLQALGAVARAEAVVDTDSLGGLALGAGAELGVRWDAFSLRVHGLGLPSRQVRLAPDQYVELSLWAAGLRGCYRASDGLPLI